MGKIRFMTTLIPEEMQIEVESKSNNNMVSAAVALQRHIYEGLLENYGKNIELINVLPIGSFPKYYKDAFVKETVCSRNKGTIYNIGFCNIQFVRKFTMPGSIYKKLIETYKNEEDGILFVYSLADSFMEALARFKKVKPDVQICAIVADLPNMSNLSSSNSVIKKKIINYFANRAYKHIDCIDYFVLLTEQMADYMNIKKPYCVMEGIATVNDNYMNARNTVSKEKIIMYTGTLHKKFGILNLIEAFEKIHNNEYRLWICGIGDSQEEVKHFEKLDSRIKYWGQKSRSEVLEMQRYATVLVNPRQNNETFTKYSFPSKILEYLSAGKPVVAYELDGMPKEYREYIYYVKDDSIQSLTNELIYICEKPKDERTKIGEKGRNFVIKNKNSIVQTKKIVDMIASQ